MFIIIILTILFITIRVYLKKKIMHIIARTCTTRLTAVIVFALPPPPFDFSKHVSLVTTAV